MRVRKRPLLLLGYLGFLFVLFEGTARLLFTIPAFANRLEADENYSWRRRWTSRHADGVELYSTFDMFDPITGWRVKPNLRDLKVFDDMILNTNSRGLRGVTEYAYSKDHDKPRVLMVGDSFIFGHEVSDTETHSFHLQRMMPHAEVISMGVNGYGHDQMLILFEQEGSKYRPDVVILGFVSQDMPRNVLRFRSYAKPVFVVDDDTLRLAGSPVPSPAEILKWDWARPRLYDVWSAVRHKLRVRSGRHERQVQEITTRLLDDMVATIESVGAIPVLVFLPVEGEINDRDKLETGEEFLLSYCREKAVRYCFSSRPHFAEKIRQGVRFKPGGHWEPSGQLTAAESIHEYLAGQHIASPRMTEKP